MNLYLSSDRLEANTSELENWIKKHGNKLILIPNAMDVYEESEIRTCINKNEEYLNLVPGFETKVVSLKKYFGKSDELRKDFKQYHAFLAVGGNVFALRKAMQLSGFDSFLKEICNKDEYLYGGYSAGICVLSPTLRGFQFVDEPLNPYNNDEILYDGIGLLDYMPIPHYNQDRSAFNSIECVVAYCKKNNINYKTLKDGETIIKEIGNELER